MQSVYFVSWRKCNCTWLARQAGGIPARCVIHGTERLGPPQLVECEDGAELGRKPDPASTHQDGSHQ